MKLLITVGTTSFDSLVIAAEKQLGNKYEVTFQIADGQATPTSSPYFDFVDNIENYYNEADLVITHGGAGTIFKLLELGKKIVVVPNLERVDHHQLDICQFMAKHNHALSCLNLECLGSVVEDALHTSFIPYLPEKFNGVAEIQKYLGLPA